AAPAAEILPPLREPEPFVADPVLEAIAPEVEAIPVPVVESIGEVSAPLPPKVAEPEATPSGPSGHLPLKGGEAAGPSGKITVSRQVEQKIEPVAEPAAAQPRTSWFQRLREGLARSSRELTGSIA